MDLSSLPIILDLSDNVDYFVACRLLFSFLKILSDEMFDPFPGCLHGPANHSFIRHVVHQPSALYTVPKNILLKILDNLFAQFLLLDIV